MPKSKKKLQKPNLEIRYPRPFWAVTQIRRPDSGIVEDICDCGVGHPNIHWLHEADPDGSLCFDLHACCGCCEYPHD